MCRPQVQGSTPGVLTGQSKRACLRREVSTDHETHGQRSGGCGRRAGALISAREALAGVHPGGRSRTREAHTHIHSQAPVRCNMWSGHEQDGDVRQGWSVQRTTRST